MLRCDALSCLSEPTWRRPLSLKCRHFMRLRPRLPLSKPWRPRMCGDLNWIFRSCSTPSGPPGSRASRPIPGWSTICCRATHPALVEPALLALWAGCSSSDGTSACTSAGASSSIRPRVSHRPILYRLYGSFCHGCTVPPLSRFSYYGYEFLELLLRG